MSKPVKNEKQLKPAERAKVRQTLDDAILAIVVAQKKPVRIPLSAMEDCSGMYGLKMEVKDGAVILTAERVNLLQG